MKINFLELDPEEYPNLREIGEKQKDWTQNQKI